jgi:hypothetical protein
MYCNIVEFKQEKRQPTKLEIINKTKPLYLCIDCEQLPTLCTPNKKEAEIYAKYNYCTISFYPVGTYEDNFNL